VLVAKRSGKIVLRMSPALHEHLAAIAKAQGVSLNHVLVEYLAGASGFKLPKN
jgi:predicted HicB family RNase H-like nuclease